MMPASTPLEDHFLRPRNAGLLEGAQVQIQVDNPVCGDTLKLYLQCAGGRVTAARFQVYGCPAAIAAGSLLTELIQGKTRSELGGITQDTIARALGGLGLDQAHAAILAGDALARAQAEWRDP